MSLDLRRTPGGITCLAAPSNQTDGLLVEDGQATKNRLPIIFLHGIGGGAQSFEPQLTGLAGGGGLLAWNMPGYHGSTALPETSFPSLRAALACFLDELEINRAHLVGQSIGGMIALDFALEHPERTASLTLIATTAAFGGRDDTFKKDFLRTRLAPLEQGASMRDLAIEAIRAVTAPDTPPKVVAGATDLMAVIAPDTWRAILECLVTFNRRDDLHRLNLPVCLIAGELDSNAPARTMRKMAEQIANADFHLIDGVGHLVNLEAPDQTNRIVQDFITRVEGERPHE